jgi:hypothetical protein
MLESASEVHPRIDAALGLSGFAVQR